MKYVGVDLHKKVISLCVVMQKAGQRVVVKRETLRCDEPRRIQSWFRRVRSVPSDRRGHEQLRVVRAAGGAAG